MKLYKFRPLGSNENFDRIKSIFNDGFYCCNFLDFNDVNEGVYPIDKNSTLMLSDKLEYKICSFSGKKTLNSQLMWGHYANSGMGVVIESEICSDEIHEVNYVKSLHKYNDTINILKNKSLEWNYENEYRFISQSNEKYFEDRKITKIYLGSPYEGLVNYNEIKKNHPKLREYLDYAEELKVFAQHSNIECEKFHLNSHA